MSFWELILLAVGLSMDAFAVSICKGLSVRKAGARESAITGLYFGGFQAMMPLAGYALATHFSQMITSVDHWIAFILLGLIGGNMIKEASSGCEECERMDSSFGWRAMLPMAIATSIDALAIGVTLAFLEVDILPSVTLVGITTFLFSAAGVKIGNLFGAKYSTRAELFGGVILVLMGGKILMEHLGIV